MEEAFAADGDWEGVQGAGELEDGTPYGFTNFEWVGGVARGAFSYRDGQPMCWAEWTQLCNVGNAEEFEYLIPTMFYLGRKLLPGYCGHGKFRGGIGQTSVHWIIKPGKRLGMSRGGAATSQTSFTALGLCGAYPSPGVFTVTAQGTNLGDVIANGGDTPRDAMEVYEYAGNGKLKVDNLQIWKSDPPELDMKDNDLWADAAGSASGWGDPLERDPKSVISDANDGSVPYEFATGMYGVVANKDDKGVWHLDKEATETCRKDLRAIRLSDARPVREWWPEQRSKVMDRDLIEPVLDMFRSSTSFNTAAANH